MVSGHGPVWNLVNVPDTRPAVSRYTLTVRHESSLGRCEVSEIWRKHARDGIRDGQTYIAIEKSKLIA